MEKEKLSPLVYNGEIINARDEMLSLTDMWRAAESPNDRRPAEWLRSADAERFMEFLKFNMGNSHIDLVQTQRGGKTPGTFAHWQIGLAYAKYLSPEFHMWCNTVVRERMEGVPVDDGGITVAALDKAVETKIGGIIKSVVVKQVGEMLTALIPALVREELAARNFCIREGKTAGQILRDLGYPRIKGLAVWFANKLVKAGCQLPGNARGAVGLTRARQFDPDKVSEYMSVGGRLLLDHKVAERRGQGVLRLVPKEAK